MGQIGDKFDLANRIYIYIYNETVLSLTLIVNYLITVNLGLRPSFAICQTIYESASKELYQMKYDDILDVDLTLIGILNDVSHEINFITQPSPFSCRSDDSARSQPMNHENIDVLTLFY